VRIAAVAAGWQWRRLVGAGVMIGGMRGAAVLARAGVMIGGVRMAAAGGQWRGLVHGGMMTELVRRRA
jgi:hypothetical protein